MFCIFIDEILILGFRGENKEKKRKEETLFGNYQNPHWVEFLGLKNMGCFPCFSSRENKASRRIKSGSSRNLMPAAAPPQRDPPPQRRHGKYIAFCI